MMKVIINDEPAGEIKRLVINPGDVLVYEAPEGVRLDAEECDQLRDELRKTVGEDITLLIVEYGTLSVIGANIKAGDYSIVSSPTGIVGHSY